MKTVFLLLFAICTIAVQAQSPGDTLVVQTFNYSQTNSSQGRDTMIDFPNNQALTYEKIIMLYNMRCKDGLISVSGNTNRGCGEWDYSCNTNITDSSKVDSVLSFTNSHSISAFSGITFNYVETPLYDYQQYRQKEVVINSTTAETLITVGTGNLALSNVVATDNKSGKSQFLYTQTELASSGVVAGDIDGLLLEVLSGTAQARYLSIKIKATNKTELNNNNPDTEDFTEVYFHDYSFNSGTNRIQFYTPFSWDGTSNLLIEFSFTNTNPDNPLSVEGTDAGFTCSLSANNGFSLNSVNGKIQLPTTPFSSVTNEMTCSFWSYGNEQLQPSSNSFFEALDSDNNRTVNIHLPWGNGSIYFDCGNSGTTYDRIDKAATADEYKGSWSHWAFTKNTTTGIMKIYHNGQPWLDGSGKTLPIDIQQFVLATSGTADRSYYGKMSEFSVWDKELSEETIQDWMYKSVDNTHPDYSNLVAYYPLNEGQGSVVNDGSAFTETADITDYLYWVFERGNLINRDFTSSTERPNLTLAQGTYNLTITDEIATDSVLLNPHIVRAYEIIPRTGTTLSDSINQISVNEYWQAQYVHTYDPDGNLIDSTEVTATGTIEINQLSYYGRYPAKYELMSFVTPYGINLDLGMEGKTWAFDVTDYAPILKGRKQMTMDRGGQRQEDIDIKFLFVIGTPPHDVLDINQIWRPDSKGYTSIMDNTSFEPRNFKFRSDGVQFKFRSVITGHGQQGEFTPRQHTLNIDEGDVEYEWTVWKECAENPIFPQGGTWIYDRAGWCPGAPSDLFEFDITPFVGAGETHTVDYGLNYANGTSNYIVNNQLVTYGAPNFTLDAAAVRILKPNAEDASQIRFNPACSYPEIVIMNTGATTLTSLQIEYYVVGGEKEYYTWNGSLGFLAQDTVVLPIPELTFWLGSTDRFVVNISNPNGQEDEYSFNNSLTSIYDDIDIYPFAEIMTIQLKTNNYGNQTSFTLYDGDGVVFYERNNCANNTVYNDDFILLAGCYQLRIDDTGDNGLDFWATPNQGTGYFRILDGNGGVLHTFDPDFGGFSNFEFGIGNITGIENNINTMSVNIFPNPTTDKVHIEISDPGKGNISIQLTSSNAKPILQREWNVSGAVFNTEIDMKELPSGVYFLQISSNNKTTTQKIVKY